MEGRDEAQALSTLRQYALDGIEYAGREIGRGSYAVVLEMNYYGLRCAGKKLSPSLYGHRVGDIVRRFSGECRLLSRLRHPNVVQFLGVHFESRGARVPVLVMEYLPTTLTQRLDKNAELGCLPDEVTHSIVSDVALGLNYLHGHSPSIIHRDLSANNVLLSKDLTAKISDLGVAKILHLNRLELSKMTVTPGNPSYMPPEALEDNPQYDTSVDVFSYGVLLIHIFSGKWPHPTKAVTVDPNDPKKLVPVSEAERRRQYLDEISHDHPLMDLILRCLNNDPTSRPPAAEILQKVKEVEARYAPASKEELLLRIKALSVSLKEVEERAKPKEKKHPTKEAPKKAQLEAQAQPHSPPKRPLPQPLPKGEQKAAADPSPRSKKGNSLTDILATMQALHVGLSEDMERAQENVTRIRGVQMSQSTFYAELEQEKERIRELVIQVEKRQESMESLSENLKNAKQRGEARVAKLHEALNKARELCGSLRHFIQVREAMLKEFQETEMKLHTLVLEAFQ